MNIFTKLTIIAGIAGLSACGNSSDELSDSNQSTDNVSEVLEAQQPIMATSEGKVTQVDQAAGRITIAHTPIPEAEWPAMTMAFDADAAILANIQQGDEITFDVQIADGGGEVRAIKKK